MTAIPTFRTWAVGPYLLEQYQFAPGPIVPVPAHAHEALQFCLNTGSGGQYRYRRAQHSFAPGSLTAINSGEAHAPGYKGFFDQPTAFRVLYIEPGSLRSLADELAGQPTDEPFFPDLQLSPRTPAARLFQLAHESLDATPADLSTDVYLLQ